ncbi:PspC domain-containing protein [Sanguibacter hominis ATCC BAA-789]|uniref:PspC domain-containing protein n=1 Tax=Sanguibacter hominis ATCC BAA-789 TaxID=1312740 RepID=A0A9X5IRL9_9MICO|nr:PspC domain-containing protein [Sanguibacter hominis]NKX92136.1 PspC domain-containing protein [Sanguibacter hominis ATCC BAA-789]
MDTTSTPPSQPDPSGAGPAWQPGSQQPPYGYTGQTPNPGAVPPPGGAPRTPSSPSLDGFFDSIRRYGIVRTDERWVAGVCGGIARRWNVDVALVRGLAVVSLLLAGAGLVLYGAAWLLLPEEADGRSHLQELFRGNFDIAVVGGFLAVVMGLSWDNPWRWFTPWGGPIEGLAWAVLVGIVIVATISAVSGRQNGPKPGPGPVPPPGQAPFSGPTPQPGPYAAAPSQAGPTAHATPQQGPYTTPPPAGAWAGSPAPAPSPSTGSSQWDELNSFVGSNLGGTPPRPAPAPKPRGPVVKGAGPVTVSIVVGVSAIVAAVLLALSRTGDFTGPVLLTSLGVLIGLSGLATMISGIRGRSTGALGGIAILAILAAGPTAAWHSLDLNISEAQGVVMGDENYSPTSVATAEKGFAMGLGNWVLDLTEVPLTPGTTVTVPATFAAGELTILVPEGSAWTAGVRLNAGSVKVVAGDDLHGSDGVSGSERRYTSSAVEDGATPTLDLSVSGLAGQIRIEES